LEKGGAPVLTAWRDRAQIRGRDVKVRSFGETLAGTAVDVDSNGALILETKDGNRKRVVAGDVEYSRRVES
jgi:BirA family biotin operon repressor/biotin-[acetyl-CoA-carboxylase] ligase